MTHIDVDKAFLRRQQIMQAAVRVFGRLGFRKASLEDVAAAAGISKQGLYLHFSSKEEVCLSSIKNYLDEALVAVDHELAQKNVLLSEKLVAALDAWFGRHIDTFSASSLDLIGVGNSLAQEEIEQYKRSFQSKIVKALAHSEEFNSKSNAASAKEIAEVLFRCGLTWKEPGVTRLEFKKHLNLAVRVCCQLKKGS